MTEAQYEYKSCKKCNTVKPLTEYHKMGTDRRRADCRVCRKIKNAECYKRRKNKCDNRLDEGEIALVSPTE